MEVKKGTIKDLTPDNKNFNRHTEAGKKMLRKSLKELGFGRSILVDKNNRIIGGNGVCEVAEQANTIVVETTGDELVVVKRTDIDLDSKKGRTMALADNTTAAADLDLDETAIADAAAEWDINVEDWLGADLGLSNNQSNTEATEDDFNEDTDQVEAICQRGDIYQLGAHRLMCGDSTSEADVALLMNGEKADIAFTSPPYNAGTTPTETKMKKETKYNGNDDNKSEESYTEFLTQYLRNTLDYTDYSFVNIQSLSNNKKSIIDMMYEFKDEFCDTMIWDKTRSQPAMANNVLNSEFEYIHIFGGNGSRAIGTIPFRGTKSNILHLSPQTKNEYADVHNATFSVEFAGYFIDNFAKQSVLDLFGGTGTTMIAAEQLNRKCYMMELDPQYCDIIIARWEKLTGKKATKLN